MRKNSILGKALVSGVISVGLLLVPTTMQAFAQSPAGSPEPVPAPSAPAKVSCEADPKMAHPTLSDVKVGTNENGRQYISGMTSDKTKNIFLGYYKKSGAWKVIKIPKERISNCMFTAIANDGIKDGSRIVSGPWDARPYVSNKYYQVLVKKFDAAPPSKATEVKANYHHVSGKAEPKSTAIITYKSDDDKWYTVETPVNAEGMFSVELKEHFIKDGLKARVTVKDATGNRSVVEMSNLVRHFAQPKLTSNVPWRVDGTAEKWKTIELVYITQDGQSKTVNTKTDKDGNFSFELNPNAQKASVVTLTVKDDNGQESTLLEARQADFAVGTPEVLDTVPAPTIREATPFEARGVVDPSDKVILTYVDETTMGEDGQPVSKTVEATVNSDGQWSITFDKPLLSGTQISVIAQNPKGYQSDPATGEIVIPEPKVSYVSSLSIKGAVKPGFGVYIFYTDSDDESQTVTIDPSQLDPNGNFSANFAPAAKGGSNVLVTAFVPQNSTDFSDIVEVVVPESAAGDVLTTPEVPTITYVSTVSVSGTATNVDNVVVTYTGVDNEQHTVKAPVVDGKFSAQFDPAAKGGTNVVAQGESALGDLSENSESALVPEATAGDPLIEGDTPAPAPQPQPTPAEPTPAQPAKPVSPKPAQPKNPVVKHADKAKKKVTKKTSAKKSVKKLAATGAGCLPALTAMLLTGIAAAGIILARRKIGEK